MRRILSSLVVFASLVAPTTAQDDVESPLGRLVDIGGRRLHLHCTGSGSPTVVIEAGASSFSIDFSLVQPDVSKTTRVCSYGRAGSGWSDARPDVETPIRVMRTLLDTAGEKRPFVMVGASRGGASPTRATTGSALKHGEAVVRITMSENAIRCVEQRSRQAWRLLPFDMTPTHFSCRFRHTYLT
jgi:hypothetical protein